MKFYSFLLFFLLSSSILSFKTNAQILENPKGQALTKRPFFEKDFIQRNKIKSITGQFIYYQLGHSPVETKDFRTFVFNKQGQLIKRIEAQQYFKQDTAVFVYRYNNDGKLRLFGRYDAYGAYAYTYSFNKDGWPTTTKFYQSSSARFSDSIPLSIDKMELIYTENSDYIDYDHQRIQTIYNSANAPYKKVFYYLDDEGRVIGETERLIRTKDEKITTYSYNDEGLIDSLSVRTLGNKQPNKLFVFHYDKDDNLLDRLEYVGGKYTYQTQVVYDPKGFFITNFIRQNMATNFMEILEVNSYKHFFRSQY